MNVTLHTLAAIATGTALAARIPERGPARFLDRRDLPWLAAGLAGNVLLHGLMDLAPHTYPLPYRLDLVAAAVLIVLTLATVRPRFVPLLAAAFLGSLLPDLVDEGPGLLNWFLSMHLPTWEVFPWHWARYSGSVYDGSQALLVVVDQVVVLVVCGVLLLASRRALGRIVRTKRESGKSSIVGEP